MLDAVIIGGGVAGLSAALYLGRFRRQVVLFDTARQANRVSHAAHGFFTRDGAAPSELIQTGREQLRPYETVQIQNGEVTGVSADAGHFSITLADGSRLAARKVLLATGLKDTLPAVAGIEDFWGHGVFHCPYCDGWEMRDKKLVILANGEAALHVAKLLRVLTDKLVICTNGPASFSVSESAALQKYGVAVEKTPLVRIEGEDGRVHAVILSDGQRLACDGIFVRLSSTQHSDFAARLGCAMTENGLVQVDDMGRTSVPGVYAAGDMAHRMRQVVVAAMHGASAAIGINVDLVAEDFVF